MADRDVRVGVVNGRIAVVFDDEADPELECVLEFTPRDADALVSALTEAIRRVRAVS
jgi:hypothetical protein